MKKEKFEKLINEFLDSLKKDVPHFIKNMDNLASFKDEDMLFIEWVHTFLDWSEVTTDMAKECYAGWDDEQ